MKKTLSILLLILCFSAKAQVTVTYTYDNLHRLTQASYSSGVNIMYSYDALGNRTQENRTITITIVNLKLNIEGYYDTATQQMRPVKMNQGEGSDATIVDDITVELVNPATNVAVATTTAVLKTNGTAVCNFQTIPFGFYYLVVKHRNTIQTWSASPVLISAIPLIYDFSSAVSKAYGDNMKELESQVYGFYSGDINQDQVIDGSDLPELNNDIENSAYGFLSTDLNGDGSTDNSDAPFIFDNITNSIFSIHP